ncbi:phage baseplate plug family protein [Entomobacter blattae]|uniref:Cyanophage baseplate Pam3 plug gp18 domain-containing protein n=1 Tax=Entomobacter blattae TaxID=2762277 RepID=A0A7H1NR76_9PROT|nr:hypothetical protein [Entomobacter blattae]QNT78286.1 hypothetical protein JGUZn3_10580 [Entomobacter blattae]
MTSLVINLSVLSHQSVQVSLGGQNVRLVIDTKQGAGTFMDIYKDGGPVILGMQCRNRTPLVQLAYLGFVGDLAFYDMQGAEDPDYTGFGHRFILVWDSEALLQ